MATILYIIILYIFYIPFSCRLLRFEMDKVKVTDGYIKWASPIKPNHREEQKTKLIIAT